MGGHEARTRPIGWWLQEASSRLDAALDVALGSVGADRRTWQVLSSLATASRSRAEVTGSLAPFDSPPELERFIAGMCERGWIADASGTLHLTSSGRAMQQDLAPLVAAVRDRISAALPPEDYLALVALLARLVEALGPDP